MTPKQKAIELVSSCNDLAKDFTRGVSMNEFSKQFALLMVNEILEELSEVLMVTASSYVVKHAVFWQNVKQEIELL